MANNLNIRYILLLKKLLKILFLTIIFVISLEYRKNLIFYIRLKKRYLLKICILLVYLAFYS